MKYHLLILGYGYTARELAKILNPEEWRISGTSRSKSKDKYSNIIGYNKVEVKKTLKNSTHILLSIPPDNQGDIVFQDFKELITKNYSTIKWIGYLSSTAVYGDHNGAWVNEETNVNPSNQKGMNRQLAENQWLKLGQENNIPVNVFRLSGIYGSNRNALLKVKSGQAISINKENQVFSRIHVLDIANLIETAMKKSLKNAIFNLADDYPCTTTEVNNYAADLLGLPKPQVIKYTKCNILKMIKEFYRDSKRVSNKKIKEVLGITLKFPTYREGIKYELETLSYCYH